VAVSVVVVVSCDRRWAARRWAWWQCSSNNDSVVAALGVASHRAHSHTQSNSYSYTPCPVPSAFEDPDDIDCEEAMKNEEVQGCY
jgi:hypothetical protein